MAKDWPNILAIDTSCDETSAAVTRGPFVLSNVISSQVRYHKKYGGVVPFLAQRLHKERIEAVISLALQRAGAQWSDIGVLAVTQGPGLAPALEVGISKVKALAAKHNLPIQAVNHMAGHLASCLCQVGAKERPTPLFPSLGVLVSGGHSEFVLMRAWQDWQVIGQTLDDALGEAYDKVAKMLGLGYPGGKLVAKLAAAGDPERYPLPVPMKQSPDYNLSYSGLKNAVRLLVKDNNLGAQEITDICASFEKVAQGSLILKVKKVLADNRELRQIWLGGGVAANMALRRRLRLLGKDLGLRLLTPANLKLCTDNAAMIGVAAWMDGLAGVPYTAAASVDRRPNLELA